MKAFVKNGNVDGAEYWFHEMQESGVTPDTVSYNVMISTCARAKDPDRAEGWLKKLLAQKGAVEADAVSFCMMIDACVRGDDVFRAEQWLLKMDTFGFEPTLTCCGTLMHAFA